MPPNFYYIFDFVTWIFIFILPPNCYKYLILSPNFLFFILIMPPNFLLYFDFVTWFFIFILLPNCYILFWFCHLIFILDFILDIMYVLVSVSHNCMCLKQ